MVTQGRNFRCLVTLTQEEFTRAKGPIEVAGGTAEVMMEKPSGYTLYQISFKKHATRMAFKAWAQKTFQAEVVKEGY